MEDRLPALPPADLPFDPPAVLARPLEIEIKLRGPASAIGAAMASPIIMRRARNRGVVRRLEATYFDAPDGRLRKAGLVYRVRRSGSRLIATVKQELDDAAALTGRAEWEAVVSSIAPDPSLLPEAASRAVRDALDDAPLRPVVTTRVRRHAVRLDVENAVIELAHDEGLVEADGRTAQLQELELELMEGTAASVVALARELVDATELRLGFLSKAERGFVLAGTPIPIVKADKPDLAPAMTLDEAIFAVFATATRHLAGNAKAAEAALRPEVVHQMRVALRRLRSTCSLIRRIVPAPVFSELSAGGKTLANALGPARDIDVFIAETLGEAEPSDRIDFSALRGEAEKRRDEAYRVAGETLEGVGASRFHLALLDTVVRRTWRERLAPAEAERLTEPAAPIAAALFDRLSRRVRKRGRHLKTMSASERHQLRITVKKLNYAVDLLAGLFEAGGKARRYQQALAKLQQALGRANDSAVLPHLLDTLTEGRPGPELVRAAAYLEGWRARDGRDTEKEVRKAWRRFREADLFW